MSKPALVIFDLDNTILNGDSDYSMINYLVQMNFLDENAEQLNQGFIDDYKRGQLDFDAYTTFALSAYIGKTRKEIDQIMAPYVETVVNPMINVFALRMIHDHRDLGDTILLASATNELIVSPIAKRLDIQNVIGTQVKFQDDKCMGSYIEPIALGSGKLQLVKKWMQSNNYESFEGVTFYSDSINDLPLLEAVDFPKAVNPDATLEKISLERGWEIINLPIL